MKPPRALLFLSAVVASIATSVCTLEAALLAYEPFDYANVGGSDRNGDGKKDVWGLAGGQGWLGEWVEARSGGLPMDVIPNYPLDYVTDISLAEPSNDQRFSLGGSLYVHGFTMQDQPTQSNGLLTRQFDEPIVGTVGSSIWFSVLIRKDAELKLDGQTRLNDRLEIGLVDSFDNIVGFGDPSNSTSFALISNFSKLAAPVPFEGHGPILGETNLLVVRLSLETGASRLEMFLNPPLNAAAPVPDISMELVDGIVNANFAALRIFSPVTRPAWTIDEIRVGETYQDVIPEPSSLVLALAGSALLGGARFRRSRSI